MVHACLAFEMRPSLAVQQRASPRARQGPSWHARPRTASYSSPDTGDSWDQDWGSARLEEAIAVAARRLRPVHCVIRVPQQGGIVVAVSREPLNKYQKWLYSVYTNRLQTETRPLSPFFIAHGAMFAPFGVL